MNILFVDDNTETRDLFRLCFQLMGHAADTAQDGPEALQIIGERAKQIDVIIMDHHMPKMTGLEVVRQLRQSQDEVSIPIILFTGDMPGILEPEAAKLGVAQVVYKPIPPADLIAAAQNAVGNG